MSRPFLQLGKLMCRDGITCPSSPPPPHRRPGKLELELKHSVCFGPKAWLTHHASHMFVYMVKLKAPIARDGRGPFLPLQNLCASLPHDCPLPRWGQVSGSSQHPIETSPAHSPFSPPAFLFGPRKKGTAGWCLPTHRDRPRFVLS